MNHVKLTDVTNSSQIAKHGYDAATSTMIVHFKTGGEYHYHGVPQDAYDALKASESVGSHLHKHIKGKFRHSQPDKK